MKSTNLGEALFTKSQQRVPGLLFGNPERSNQKHYRPNLAIVGLCVAAGALPLAVLLVYLAVSALTFSFYAWDKSSAQRNAQRTSESTLHALGLLGGWPGAMVAQQTLRHKSSKAEFRFVFWITVVVNCGVFVWLFTDSGTGVLNGLLAGVGN